MQQQPVPIPSQAIQRDQSIQAALAILQVVFPYVTETNGTVSDMVTVNDKSLKICAQTTAIHALSRLDSLLNAPVYWEGKDVQKFNKLMHAHMAAQIRLANTATLPRTQFRPTLTRDGDLFVARYGIGRDEISASGSSPEAALRAYDRAFIGRTEQHPRV